MSRYDGLIIPRSYSEYINKTDAATLQQALQLSGVLSGTVAAGDNKAVKSDAVNSALAEYQKNIKSNIPSATFFVTLAIMTNTYNDFNFIVDFFIQRSGITICCQGRALICGRYQTSNSIYSNLQYLKGDRDERAKVCKFTYDGTVYCGLKIAATTNDAIIKLWIKSRNANPTVTFVKDTDVTDVTEFTSNNLVTA
jgi:hypothetical protein